MAEKCKCANVVLVLHDSIWVADITMCSSCEFNDCNTCNMYKRKVLQGKERCGKRQ